MVAALLRVGLVCATELSLNSAAMRRAASSPELASSLDDIRSEAARVLRQHVLCKWFPGAIDPSGGFHQHFGPDWSRLDDGGVRSLVYQSRLTWTAAAAAPTSLPKAQELLHPAIGHGLAFMTEQLWDGRCGGLFWSVDREGRPAGRWSNEKHSYGQAFAIYAAAASYAASRDERALALARSAFEWLERHARDRTHGGYFEVLARDGARVSAAAAHDAIGTPYGLKSANTHLHLLEAFTELHSVWPAPAVASALGHVLEIVRDRICAPRRGAPPLLTRSWAPASRAISFGHDLEAAHLLIAAAERLGETAQTLPVARRLVDQALAHGYDRRHGGVFQGRSGWLGRLDRSKIWWTQAEALVAFAVMHDRLGGETTLYGERLVDAWRFVCAFQLDHVHGGWLAHVDRRGRAHVRPKSDSWTDPYHQTRASLALMGPAEAPSSTP